MFELDYLREVLNAWRSKLGATPQLKLHSEGRELWRVAGSSGDRYFLKRLGPWRNLPLEDEAAVLEFLSDRGIRTTPFVPTDNGSLFAGEIEDSFVLIPEIGNQEISPEMLLEQEHAIGTEIARLHQVLAEYPGEVNSYRESVLDSLGDELNLPYELKERLAPRIPAMLASFAGLPEQLIHGDLTPDNIVLGEHGTPPGFIDFEHLPVGPRIWDIAKYVSRRFRTRWYGESGPSDTDRLNHAINAIRGYDAAGPMDYIEKAALPAAILAANIVEVAYFRDVAEGKLERRMLPDHLDVLADSVEGAKWHLHNYDLIQTTLNDALR